MIFGLKESVGRPPCRLRKSILAAFMSAAFLVTGFHKSVYSQEAAATRGRRVSNSPAAEATITINEKFLNSFLQAMFDNLREPSLNIGGGSSSGNGEGGCASEIRLKGETGGVRTAV